MADVKHDESGDSGNLVGQKRQNSENGGPASKKAHVSDAEVQVKVLIPSGAVGALIGKGGETMRTLKNDSGCRVQMSKNQEVYPGTTERICLVKGKISACMMVMHAIVEKIQEKIDSSAGSDQFDLKGTDRNKEMKLVVPNTSAGMVIGKSGASIKEIRETTGANVQVYPKAGSDEAKASSERVITLGSDSNTVLLEAVQRVLEKVSADPLHAQSSDVSVKQEFNTPGQMNSSFDFGGNRLSGSTTGLSNIPSFNSGSNTVWQSQSSLVSDNFSNPNKNVHYNSAQPVKFNPLQGLGNTELLSFLDNLQSTLRSSGFNEASVGEIMQAMQVLAKYNIMGLGLGLGVAAMAQMRTAEATQMMVPPQQTQRYDLAQPLMNSSSGLTSLLDTGDHSLGGHAGGVLIDVMSQKKNGSDSNSANTFARDVIKEKLVEAGHMELEVPDAIVGAVLGPRAKTLVEIQQLSGCKVEVHKRGSTTTSPGCRLISLTGDDSACLAARGLMERVINQEQSRRQSGGPSSSSGTRNY